MRQLMGAANTSIVSDRGLIFSASHALPLYGHRDRKGQLSGCPFSDARRQNVGGDTALTTTQTSSNGLRIRWGRRLSK
jgi:hypothetical protein